MIKKKQLKMLVLGLVVILFSLNGASCLGTKSGKASAEKPVIQSEGMSEDKLIKNYLVDKNLDVSFVEVTDFREKGGEKLIKVVINSNKSTIDELSREISIIGSLVYESGVDFDTLNIVVNNDGWPAVNVNWEKEKIKKWELTGMNEDTLLDYIFKEGIGSIC